MGGVGPGDPPQSLGLALGPRHGDRSIPRPSPWRLIVPGASPWQRAGPRSLAMVTVVIGALSPWRLPPQHPNPLPAGPPPNLGVGIWVLLPRLGVPEVTQDTSPQCPQGMGGPRAPWDGPSGARDSDGSTRLDQPSGAGGLGPPQGGGLAPPALNPDLHWCHPSPLSPVGTPVPTLPAKARYPSVHFWRGHPPPPPWFGYTSAEGAGEWGRGAMERDRAVGSPHHPHTPCPPPSCPTSSLKQAQAAALCHRGGSASGAQPRHPHDGDTAGPSVPSPPARAHLSAPGAL